MFAMQIWLCEAPRRGLHHLRTYKQALGNGDRLEERVRTEEPEWDEGTTPSAVKSLFNLWS